MHGDQNQIRFIDYGNEETKRGSEVGLGILLWVRLILGACRKFVSTVFSRDVQYRIGRIAVTQKQKTLDFSTRQASSSF